LAHCRRGVTYIPSRVVHPPQPGPSCTRRALAGADCTGVRRVLGVRLACRGPSELLCQGRSESPRTAGCGAPAAHHLASSGHMGAQPGRDRQDDGLVAHLRTCPSLLASAPRSDDITSPPGKGFPPAPVSPRTLTPIAIPGPCRSGQEAAAATADRGVYCSQTPAWLELRLPHLSISVVRRHGARRSDHPGRRCSAVPGGCGVSVPTASRRRCSTSQTVSPMTCSRSRPVRTEGRRCAVAGDRRSSSCGRGRPPIIFAAYESAGRGPTVSRGLQVHR
jgi:hypothetical protein